MATWKDEYIAHIREAEKNNPVNLEIVEACISTPHTPLSTIHSPHEPPQRRPVD